MKVGLLTLEQKEAIQGQKYAQDSLFNPIQDIDGDWVISIEEMEFCINEDFSWVKELNVIDFIPNPSKLIN